jgi:hypothetical protein
MRGGEPALRRDLHPATAGAHLASTMTGSAGVYAGLEPGMVRNRRVPDWLPTVEAGEDAHSPAWDNPYHQGGSILTG